MDNAPFYSGAGPRRDKTLADAESQALSGAPPPAPKPAAPAPPAPSVMDRVKNLFAGRDKANDVPDTAKHPPGSRGM